MILRKKNKPFKYDGKTYFIGEEIVALNNSEYSGLFGRIVEIRNGADKETDNKTPDIYCEFDPPLFPKDIEELEKRFSCLYKAPKKLDDITLDSVIMAPDMIKSVAEKTDGHKITIYSLEEDWAYDDDYGHTTEIFLIICLQRKSFVKKSKMKKKTAVLSVGLMMKNSLRTTAMIIMKPILTDTTLQAIILSALHLIMRR